MELTNSAINYLADGVWTVIFENVRDEIGNFHDADTTTPGVDDYSVTLEIQ